MVFFLKQKMFLQKLMKKMVSPSFFNYFGKIQFQMLIDHNRFACLIGDLTDLKMIRMMHVQWYKNLHCIHIASIIFRSRCNYGLNFHISKYSQALRFYFSFVIVKYFGFFFKEQSQIEFQKWHTMIVLL